MKTLLKTILSAFLWIFTLTCLAEGGFRTAVFYRYLNELGHYYHDLLVYDRTKPYQIRMRPNTARKRATPNGGSPWEYRINALGFRGPAPDLNGGEAGRILVLGDSAAFGWAVNDNQNFPSLLGELLRKKGIHASVFNAGVPGFSTVQEAQLVKDVFPAAMPRVVALAYAVNDAEPQQMLPLAPRLRYRGNLLWSVTALKRKLSPPEARVDYNEGFKPGSWKGKASKKALEQINRYAKQHAAVLVVFILPDFTQPFDASYPYRGIHRAVAEWGKELGIPVFDLLPYFEGKVHTHFAVSGDGHPNPLAHRAIAGAMVKRLRPYLEPRAPQSRDVPQA
ncbi:MAG TPA: SGNH/GDSL hydrolase family protein [Verrucomicrobiae bacterium]|nr:SGNH/GDSL hydrolase family protein [Verrucomicrobiae bacterium]